MVYPNSTPEFRIFKKQDGEIILQVRYINLVQGYKSKWQAVPVVEEEQKENTNVCN
jgi:hypothetical protein